MQYSITIIVTWGCWLLFWENLDPGAFDSGDFLSWPLSKTITGITSKDKISILLHYYVRSIFKISCRPVIKGSNQKQSFIWKWVLPTGTFLCKSKSFSYEWSCRRTRFETERQGSLEMACCYVWARLMGPRSYRWTWLLVIHSKIGERVAHVKVKGSGASKHNNNPIFHAILCPCEWGGRGGGLVTWGKVEFKYRDCRGGYMLIFLEPPWKAKKTGLKNLKQL